MCVTVQPTSTDESIVADDLLADAAVFGLLKRLHPESMRMKSLQLLWLQFRKSNKDKRDEMLQLCL